MKVLVTGASGYLGGRLCDALLRRGHSVRALVRSTSDISALSSHIEIFYGDVTDYASLLAAFSSCSVVFHLAALVEPWLPDPSKFFSVNVGGLKNVLAAVKETRTVEKLVYTSSFFALGPTDEGIADENQVHHEKFFCTEYEKSKVAADKIALQAASEGVPIVLLYPGVIYGPGKVTAGNVVARMIVERFSGRLPGYIGYGSDKFSFSHVEDVVEGHIAAIEKGEVLNIPLWLIEAYGWLLVFFARITGKLPLISPPTVHVLRHRWEYSCDKAKRELDYRPRSLKEGLVEQIGTCYDLPVEPKSKKPQLKRESWGELVPQMCPDLLSMRALSQTRQDIILILQTRRTKAAEFEIFLFGFGGRLGFILGESPKPEHSRPLACSVKDLDQSLSTRPSQNLSGMIHLSPNPKPRRRKDLSNSYGA
uniref:Dihydroflavonol-4-reductase n=1 Tax=Cajanus cajan TaxID=3821 RepID=A0A151TBX0_CAJCA|nr:Putative dihydroflavonol-4-reductase [Cajanus cajan]